MEKRETQNSYWLLFSPPSLSLWLKGQETFHQSLFLFQEEMKKSRKKGGFCNAFFCSKLSWSFVVDWGERGLKLLKCLTHWLPWLIFEYLSKSLIIFSLSLYVSLPLIFSNFILNNSTPYAKLTDFNETSNLNSMPKNIGVSDLWL